jgi:hypothetical protein
MATVTGCATPGVDLVDAGTVSVDARLHKSMLLRHIHAYQEDEDVVVKGLVITPRFGSFSKPTGHLDIQYVDQVGRLLHERYAKLVPASTPMSGRRMPKFMRVEKALRFSARAQMIAATGSAIRIAYHDGLHGEERPPDPASNHREIRE